MIKQINIKGTKQEIFLVYLNTINWTLSEPLTESEIEVLSYLLYYNNMYYKEIKSDSIRYDLLFSSTIKKKIREEFNIEPQKFEVYLNKLRKKNIIIDNQLSNKVVIYLDNKLEIRFSVEEKEEPKFIETPVERKVEEMPEVPEYVTNTDEDPV